MDHPNKQKGGLETASLEASASAFLGREKRLYGVHDRAREVLKALVLERDA
jgi:hypothetical protein